MLLSLAMFAALPIDGLAALDPLAGHCWRGELKPGELDTHCFTRTDTGIRDHHEVTIGGTMVYWGESDFTSAAKPASFAFAYRNAGGPVSSGIATVTAEGVDFGRVQWRWIDDKSYDMHREGSVVRFARVN